jgi:hypothetical protein
MIEGEPTNWRELQERVAAILRECGMSVGVEADVDIVRGTVNIDVYADDLKQRPPAKFVCECKCWKKSIPKTVVHALRTVVADSGSNWGLIISSKGFQSGAREAAENSNVRLVRWEEFQQMFAPRWWKEFAVPKLKEAGMRLLPFVDTLLYHKYTLQVNSMKEPHYAVYCRIRDQYRDLADFAVRLTYPGSRLTTEPPKLPLNMPRAKRLAIPRHLLQETHLRAFVDIMCAELAAGTSEMASFFERAVSPS